jgi:hypothetical protein
MAAYTLGPGKVGQAQPIDGPGLRNEGSRPTITDDGVVADLRCALVGRCTEILDRSTRLDGPWRSRFPVAHRDLFRATAISPAKRPRTAALPALRTRDAEALAPRGEDTGVNRPSAPRSSSTGSNRLSGPSDAGSAVICPSQARRATMPSRMPGATIVPRMA